MGWDLLIHVGYEGYEGLKKGLKLLKANIFGTEVEEFIWIYGSCLKLGVAIGMFIPLVG